MNIFARLFGFLFHKPQPVPVQIPQEPVSSVVVAAPQVNSAPVVQPSLPVTEAPKVPVAPTVPVTNTVTAPALSEMEQLIRAGGNPAGNFHSPQVSVPAPAAPAERLPRLTPAYEERIYRVEATAKPDEELIAELGLDRYNAYITYAYGPGGYYWDPKAVANAAFKASH
jgi:hypothetical protein